MPIEHDGPAPISRPKPTRTGSRQGWIEHDELDPCPECGTRLIQTFTEHKFAGRTQPMRSSGPLQCRNGHPVAQP